MVRDGQGRKMSKSLGNVIDPLEVIDGASYQVALFVRWLSVKHVPEILIWVECASSNSCGGSIVLFF